MKKILNIAVIMALCGFIVTGCTLFKKKDKPNKVDAPEKPIENVDAPVAVDVGNDILKLPLAQTGSFVGITQATMPAQGFIVIRDDLFGQPGVVVGVSDVLPAGMSENITVPLRVGQTTGSIYYASVFLDDGDLLFRQTDDEVLTDESGSVKLVKFNIQEAGDFEADIKF